MNTLYTCDNCTNQHMEEFETLCHSCRREDDEALRNELIDALQLMVDDLENNGEILRTDSARIEMMTNTLAKAGGNK